MSEVEIKILKIDDFKEFISLIDLNEAGEGLIEEMEDNSEEMYALMLGDKVVGVSYMENDDDPFFTIYIFKEYRNKGYGTKALKEIEKIYDAAPADHMWAIYCYYNETAIHFLRKNGYALTWASTLMKYSGNKFEEPNLPVRQYRDEDFEQAFALSSEAFHKMRVGTGCFPNSVVGKPGEKTRENWLKDAENEFVIDINGEIIGFANLEDEELDTISIKISHQNKGLGKQFVKYMTNRLIDRGVEEPLLWCIVGNNNARHIYDSLGYKEVFCQGFAKKIIK